MKENICKKYKKQIIVLIGIIVAFILGVFVINLIKIYNYRNQIHEGVLICLNEKKNINELENALIKISNKYNVEDDITFNYHIRDMLNGKYMVYSIIAGKEFKDVFNIKPNY